MATASETLKTLLKKGVNILNDPLKFLAEKKPTSALAQFPLALRESLFPETKNKKELAEQAAFGFLGLEKQIGKAGGRIINKAIEKGIKGKELQTIVSKIVGAGERAFTKVEDKSLKPTLETLKGIQPQKIFKEVGIEREVLSPRAVFKSMGAEKELGEPLIKAVDEISTSR